MQITTEMVMFIAGFIAAAITFGVLKGKIERNEKDIAIMIKQMDQTVSRVEFEKESSSTHKKFEELYASRNDLAKAAERIGDIRNDIKEFAVKFDRFVDITNGNIKELDRKVERFYALRDIDHPEKPMRRSTDLNSM